MSDDRYYCSGCWTRDHGVSDPPLHEHAEGCFQRHLILGERLSPVLVARGPHECGWRDCGQGGVYVPPEKRVRHVPYE